ncbi:Hypothetical predicted protein, partial [Marmota monax]
CSWTAQPLRLAGVTARLRLLRRPEAAAAAATSVTAASGLHEAVNTAVEHADQASHSAGRPGRGFPAPV